jgi:GNAT superfamily N-acetyltransferase
VKEEYREKGIGSALVGKTCNWAKEKGKEKIWVEVSKKAGDFGTVLFYKKHGFEEIGAFRDQKGEEYVTMLKQL